MSSTAKADVKLIKNALQGLKLPEPGTVWIGPFEQLQGAAYALLAAERHGVYERNFHEYHAKVRAKVVALILQHAANEKLSDKDAFDNAVAGFYFNSAIQRIVWAAERLVTAFVSVECSCCGAVERSAICKTSHFSDFLKDARRRLKHIGSSGGQGFLEVSKFLQLFTRKPYRRESPYDPGHILAMLQYDVNNRKHAIYGPLARDRKTADLRGNAKPSRWSNAPQHVQMHLSCAAFEAVCRAYDELKDWQPNVQA